MADIFLILTSALWLYGKVSVYRKYTLKCWELMGHLIGNIFSNSSGEEMFLCTILATFLYENIVSKFKKIKIKAKVIAEKFN